MALFNEPLKLSLGKESTCQVKLGKIVDHNLAQT
eukprot:CAMPEP_0116881530 /NCGR_PEP_ID=MMETSP0463-20121206/13627_1 /TAXON_ID=181622 /ORGANISM="Strombidinopsis sp, Strain SopsisLIS2011" /LENGTH=33 /DNA_ID= /DNA_START= /DNA_END= /DNA_ORIENTATION=